MADRPRARESGIAPGILPPGPLNAITDVAGVRVGHVTAWEGDDVRTGAPAGLIAARFHNTIVELIRAVCVVARRERGLTTVVLSGGCFQNMFLLEHSTRRLEEAGFDVRCHRLVPTNDGGLSLGQVGVALAKMRDT